MVHPAPTTIRLCKTVPTQLEHPGTHIPIMLFFISFQDTGLSAFSFLSAFLLLRHHLLKHHRDIDNQASHYNFGISVCTIPTKRISNKLECLDTYISLMVLAHFCYDILSQRQKAKGHNIHPLANVCKIDRHSKFTVPIYYRKKYVHSQ